MKRISTSTKAVDLFGAGKHGWRDGDLAIGVQPTDAEAIWFNNLQEEVCNVIETNGIALDGNVRTQLYQAIQLMIAGSAANDYKASVRFTTTGNIVLSGLGTQAGGDWGAALTAGDRILPKEQTAGADRTIWIAAAGAWTRATDADGVGELTSGAIVAVEEGTTLADSQWMLTTDGTITIGTTALTWTRKDGGIVPDSSTTVKGKVQLATAAEAQAGLDALKSITPATLLSALKGSNQSLAAIGYQKLPGGLIIQWGTTGSIGVGGAISVTFPISFPASVVFASLQAFVNGVSANAAQGVTATTTGLSATGTNTSVSQYFWLSIGF